MTRSQFAAALESSHPTGWALTLHKLASAKEMPEHDKRVLSGSALQFQLELAGGSTHRTAQLEESCGGDATLRAAPGNATLTAPGVEMSGTPSVNECSGGSDGDCLWSYTFDHVVWGIPIHFTLSLFCGEEGGGETATGEPDYGWLIENGYLDASDNPNDGSYDPGGTSDPNNPSGPSSEQDGVSSMPEPDCTQTQTNPYARAYCAGLTPTGTQKERMESALDVMRTKGAECASLATTFLDLLSLDPPHVHVFPDNNENFEGGSGVQSDWVTIRGDFVDTYYASQNAAGHSLSSVIAHEMDHVQGNTSALTDSKGHLLSNPLETLHSQSCK